MSSEEPPDLKKIQQRFESAVAEYEQQSKKLGYSQKAIVCNDFGVFINFAGVEINYSNYALADNLEYYLAQQEIKHTSFSRVLQDHQINYKKRIWQVNSRLYSYLHNLAKPSSDDLDKTIQLAITKIAFDKTIKEGSLLGKYFFEEIASDYTTNKPIFEENRKRIVLTTEIINETMSDIETMDTTILHYLSNKQLTWYGKEQKS